MIYFSLLVRNSPFSKDFAQFVDSLSMMDDRQVDITSASAVLPYHGDGGVHGVVYATMKGELSADQQAYFDQFAMVYDSEAAFNLAKDASFDLHCRQTPSPG